MQMGPSRRSQCLLWITGIRFSRQDCEASEGVVAVSRSGGGNMGTRGHVTCQYPFLFKDRGAFS